MKEHDIVVSLEPIESIPTGTKGTIVHVYDETAFEVEFFKGTQTIEVVTVKAHQIQLR